jgi:sugar phosphate permease
MVFTHIPSNILLILVGFAPNLSVAIALYLTRMALSQMDVPTRQSYTVRVVDEGERTAAAGITNVSRNVAQTISPVAYRIYFTVVAIFGCTICLKWGVENCLRCITSFEF